MSQEESTLIDIDKPNMDVEQNGVELKTDKVHEYDILSQIICIWMK